MNCPSSLVRGQYIPFIPKTTRPRKWINAAMSALYFRCSANHHGTDPAIIHETYYSAVKLAPKKIKTVITVYDMIHEKFQSQFNYGDKTTTIKANAIKRADHIICISRSTKNDLLEKFDTLSGKISVVHLASSLMLDDESDTLSYPKHDPYILYVGARGGYKNFHGLIDAYAHSKRLMSDFKILCFGGGPFRKDEKLKIQKLGILQNNILQISGDDNLLATCYRDAAVFIYPSLYEGFGIPLLEAMNCHCPVVCSNTSSFPEVAGDAADYFDPNDIDSIKHTLESVLYSTTRTQSLIELGNQRRLNFSWDKCAEKTASIYRTLS